jgi:hypothetical protein
MPRIARRHEHTRLRNHHRNYRYVFSDRLLERQDAPLTNRKFEKMKFFAMLTAASIVTCGAIAQESYVAAEGDQLGMPASSSLCDPQAEADAVLGERLPCIVPMPRPRPTEADQMNTIVHGKPVFMLDGKPFTPPVVAGEDEGEAAPLMTFAPIPYLPAELKKQMTPHQRIEHSFSVFE